MDLVKETKEYLKYVRKHPCSVAGCTNIGQVEADHLEARGMGGRKRKGTHTGTLVDFTCVPLCRSHHTERHSKTLRDFEDKHKINLWKVNSKMVRDFYVL